MPWLVHLHDGTTAEVTKEELDLPYESKAEFDSALYEAVKKKT